MLIQNIYNVKGLNKSVCECCSIICYNKKNCEFDIKKSTESHECECGDDCKFHDQINSIKLSPELYNEAKNYIELKSYEHIENMKKQNNGNSYYQQAIIEFEQRIKSCLSTVQLYEFEK